MAKNQPTNNQKTTAAQDTAEMIGDVARGVAVVPGALANQAQRFYYGQPLGEMQGPMPQNQNQLAAIQETAGVQPGAQVDPNQLVDSTPAIAQTPNTAMPVIGESLKMSGVAASGIGEAARQKGEAEGALGQGIHDEIKKVQKESEDIDRRIEASQLKQQIVNSEINEKLTQAMSDLKIGEGGITLDQRRFWKNQTTGSKIAAAIGVFLGGFRPSGKNNALSIIQSAIDNDINAQKLDIIGKKQKFQNLNTYYGVVSKLFKDEREAGLAAKTLAWDNLAKSIMALKEKARGPIAKANAEILLNEVLFKRGMSLGQLSGVITESRNINQQFGMATSGKKTTAQDIASLPPERRVGFIKDFTGEGDPTVAKQIRKARPDVERSLNALKKLYNFSLKPAVQKRNPLSTERAAVQFLVASMPETLRLPLFGEGPLTVGRKQLAKEITVDPTKFFSIGKLDQAKLLETMELINGHYIDMALGAGYEDVPIENRSFEQFINNQRDNLFK